MANDTLLYLYGTDGTTQLAFNDDVGWTTWYLGYYYYRESIITWTATLGGTYYVRELQWGPTGGYPNIRDCHAYSLWVQDVTGHGLALAKTTATLSYQAAGNTIDYNYLLTNTGTVTLYAPFQVADDHVGGGTAFSCDSATSLDPGNTVNCSVSYTVTGADVTAGFVTNHATATAMDKPSGGNTVTSNPDSVTVYEDQWPSISEAFAPNPIAVGDTSVLTFTITDPDTNVFPLTGVGFTDTLPGGLSVANSSAPQCGGTLTTLSATNAVNLSGATIGVGGTCTFGITVTGTSAGLQTNTTGNVTSTNGGMGNRASAALTVVAPAMLPLTGFAPGAITSLAAEPDHLYGISPDLTIEIPSLAVKTTIVGVPQAGGTWDVSWLGDQVGYLEGTAFPTWSGNSVVTGHVYGADGLPGPFVNLKTLKWGDRVIIHLTGQRYIFEVRTNEVISPTNTSIFSHKDYPWLTLLTCKDYNAQTNSYAHRVAVGAVLIKTETDPPPGP